MIGIIGKGFVGNAVKNSFERHGYQVKAHDKFKEGDTFEEVSQCDYIFICVPTLAQVDGSIDLTAIDETMERLACNKARGIVVIKSTIIPGTAQCIATKYPTLNILSNPEFLTARTAEYDNLHPDKIIIGYTLGKERFARRLAVLYDEFAIPARIVKSEEAETIKYMLNTYYATCIIFANEIYDLCQALHIDYEIVRGGFELDKYVVSGNFDVWYDGYRGFGGHCLPKDLSAILAQYESLDLNPKLLKAVQVINNKLLEIQ